MLAMVVVCVQDDCRFLCINFIFHFLSICFPVDSLRLSRYNLISAANRDNFTCLSNSSISDFFLLMSLLTISSKISWVILISTNMILPRSKL